MKIKIIDIVGSERAMNDMLMERVSPGFGLRFRKVVKTLKEEIGEFNEAKDAIIRDYGIYEPTTGQWAVDMKDPVKREAYVEGVNNLLDTEVELSIPTFALDELKREGIKPPAGVFVGLWFIFEEDSENGTR